MTLNWKVQFTQKSYSSTCQGVNVPRCRPQYICVLHLDSHGFWISGRFTDLYRRWWLFIDPFRGNLLAYTNKWAVDNYGIYETWWVGGMKCFEGPQIANLELVVAWTLLITLPAVYAKVQIAKVFFFFRSPASTGIKKPNCSPSVESLSPSLSLTPILSSFTRLSVRLCVFCAAL